MSSIPVAAFGGKQIDISKALHALQGVVNKPVEQFGQADIEAVVGAVGTDPSRINGILVDGVDQLTEVTADSVKQGINEFVTKFREQKKNEVLAKLGGQTLRDDIKKVAALDDFVSYVASKLENDQEPTSSNLEARAEEIYAGKVDGASAQDLNKILARVKASGAIDGLGDLSGKDERAKVAGAAATRITQAEARIEQVLSNNIPDEDGARSEIVQLGYAIASSTEVSKAYGLGDDSDRAAFLKGIVSLINVTDTTEAKPIDIDVNQANLGQLVDAIKKYTPDGGDSVAAIYEDSINPNNRPDAADPNTFSQTVDVSKSKDGENYKFEIKLDQLGGNVPTNKKGDANGASYEVTGEGDDRKLVITIPAAKLDKTGKDSKDLSKTVTIDAEGGKKISLQLLHKDANGTESAEDEKGFLGKLKSLPGIAAIVGLVVAIGGLAMGAKNSEESTPYLGAGIIGSALATFGIMKAFFSGEKTAEA